MSRSSLARSFVRLARQCRTARGLGIPVAALRSMEAETAATTRLSRRGFLTGLTAGAAGLAFARRVSAHASGIAQPRVAIVGAGISGLNCALALLDRGIVPTVYEAAFRLGGRMYSDNTGYWNDNQVTEWCGEEIQATHTTILALATRFGIPVDMLPSASQSGQTDTYYFKGAYYPLTQAAADFAAVSSTIDDAFNAAGAVTTFNTSTPGGRRLDKMSVNTWIAGHVPGGLSSNLGQLLSLIMVDEFGADAGDLSALNLIYFFGGPDLPGNAGQNGTTDVGFHIRGGNELLPQAIASHLTANGVPIQMGMSMAAIQKRPDGTLRMSFETGATTQDVDADLVVLTVPFAVLRNLDCKKADFDSRKRMAIRNLGRGMNGKLYLQFSHRLWNDPGPWGVSDGASFGDTGCLATIEPTRAQPGSSGILSNLTGGPFTKKQASTTSFARIDNAGVKSDAQNFLTQIAPVFPGLPALWNGKAAQSLPHLSPFFNCSFSYWRPGQFQSIAGYERVRQHNIFFAGEHTSVSNQGFMEGAAQEGVRAAGEILTQLGM